MNMKVQPDWEENSVDILFELHGEIFAIKKKLSQIDSTWRLLSVSCECVIYADTHFNAP